METLIQSAEGGRKRVHQVTKATFGRGGGNTLQDARQSYRGRVREMEVSFKCGPCVSKHWQVGDELQEQTRSSFARKGECSEESGCRFQGQHGNYKNGFPLWLPLDLNDECCERILTMLIGWRWQEIGQCQHHSLSLHSQKFHQRAADSAAAHTYKVV